MGILYRFLIITGLLLCSVSAQNVFYSQNFESSTSDMVVSGGGWEFGTPTYSSGPTTVPEGSKCTGTILNGNYGDYVDYNLETPLISISGPIVKLSFYQWYSTESCCDSMYVDIFKEGSTTWTTLSLVSGVLNSWNLKNIDISSYTNSKIKIRFRFTSDGSVEAAGWYLDRLQVYNPVSKLLTVNNSGNGTTTPSGSVSIETSTPYSISATANTGYRFSNWTVQSGSATFGSSTLASTNVSITSDAVIRANFTQCPVYQITGSATQYNYTTNSYDLSAGSGVGFYFSPSATGNYSVSIQNVESHSSNFYYYGTDAAFSSAVQSKTNSSTSSISFNATAGARYYFKVVPGSSSYWSYNFRISSGSAYSLVVNNDGHGTTSPSGSVALASGESRSISATPSSGYRFVNWTVQSGSAVLVNPTLASASVSITGDAAIQANFIAGTVYDLSSIPSSYNFTTNNFEISPLNGVRLKFRAPSPGTYAIVIDSSYKNMYYYGTSSAFLTAIGNTGYNSTRIIYQFTATTAGEYHYFKIVPYSSSYYTTNFIASVRTPLTLIVRTNGKGTIFPNDTVNVFSSTDTAITAIPNGGYQFSNWTLVSGNATFSNSSTALTRIAVTSDTAEVMACFIINPNTKPDVNITDLNISSHPDICVTASVSDTAGRSITGLDTSNFILTQDNDTLDYQLTTVSNVAGISVALVIDRSGSMSGTIGTSKNAALQYVRTMNSMDRCAIVSFNDSYTINQTITGDTSLLVAAINGITATGGTAILNATDAGLTQLLQETNTRAVIVYSDGQDGGNTVTIDSLVNHARHNNIKIYSIGIGTSADTTELKPIADSTGGYYSFAPSATDLAQLYMQIKGDVQAQYILCYQSPDVIFNGDNHTVVLSAKLNNRTDKDTAYWNENNMPPVITLTSATSAMIGVNQPSMQALTISATVTDDGTVDNVRLFYRKSNIVSGSYTEIPMPLLTGNTYQAIISAANVIYPGIDFYILASDNYHLIGRSPNVLVPESQPYVIPVANEVPVIVHTPPPCLSVQNASVSAHITDQDGTFCAVLYYKRTTETFFASDTMHELTNDNYSAVIPPNFVTVNGVDYYIRAVDSVGAATRFPHSGNIATSQCGENHIPVASAGNDQNLFAGADCLNTVKLDGSGSMDPDGDPITYSWTGPFTGQLTGVSPSVNLSTGTNQIILTVTDSYGNSDRDTVLIVIQDVIPPVPNVPNLPVLRRDCSLTVNTFPTAADNCSQIISATTNDPYSFSQQGKYKINWIYTDASGNTATQEQQVIIEDKIAPDITAAQNIDMTISALADSAMLTVDSADAIDNCTSVLLTAARSDNLPLSNAFHAGLTKIIWSACDTNKNCATAEQIVTVRKNNLPVLAILPDTSVNEMQTISIAVSATDPDLTVPKISLVNSPAFLSIGGNGGNVIITASPGCGMHGIYTVTVQASDGIDSVTSIFKIQVKDTAAPKITVKPDKLILISSLLDSSIVIIDSAKAVDSCSAFTLTATRSDNLLLSNAYYPGRTDITWNACDINGNCASAAQSITVRKNRVPFLTMPHDTVMNEKELILVAVSASDSDATVPVISLVSPPPFLTISNNAGNTVIRSAPGCSDHGVYTVVVKASDGIDSVTSTFKLQVDDVNFAPVFADIANQKAVEQRPFNLSVNVSDCDGTIPSIRMINNVSEAVFADNLNGSATFAWTPGGDENGFYVVIFEASDGVSTIRDTVLIEVVDANCYPPVLNVSSTAVTSSVNLPVAILVTATDLDGVLPVIGITTIPSGAVFTVDDNTGTGVFTWTPAVTGIYSFTISAVDAFDPLVVISKEVVITINNDNITGPVFTPRNDTIINQNKEMIMSIEAKDPDGNIPQLYLISGPAGARVVDNKNGTGFIAWNPSCDISGVNSIIAGASDGLLSDTLAINVNVRDVNCAPVINHISDITASAGELVKLTVSAIDPDNDGSIPVLSSACDIPGFTFVTSADATAEFRCIAPSAAGLYRIVFYATDGIATDSMAVMISVEKYGSVKISADKPGAAIFAMPSGCFSGNLLGHDSVSWRAPQGVYWFEVQADGYRAQRFSCNVKADTVVTQTVNLKTSIPLMFSGPDTLTVTSAEPVSLAGSFSFVDLNRDNTEDLFIASVNKGLFFSGLDNVTKKSYRYQPSEFIDLTSSFNTRHHVFADWDNNGIYDCILSDRSGNIIAVRQRSTIDTLVRGSASGCPVVFDVNKDGKKDLIVHIETLGLFVYTNIGTDSDPVLSNPVECKSAETGLSITSCSGTPALIDLDNDNHEEILMLSNGAVKVFDIDSTFTLLTFKEVLNCAGVRIAADSVSMSLIGSTRGTPKLAVRTNDKILIYQSHLLGDVNNDSVVNIQDISKISKQLELPDTVSGYNREINLKLSDTGNEVIDVRDITRASKCWEMHE